MKAKVGIIVMLFSCYCRCCKGAVAPTEIRQSPMQISRPEHPPPLAGPTLAGDRLSHIAASPGDRIPELSGRGKMQGKIKDRGTSVRENPVCTWGGRGTRLECVACREKRQCRVRTDIAACHLRPLLLEFAGGSP